MTVRELIELLSSPDFNQDDTVHFTYNYGDHCRTQVAPEIEEVSHGYVEHSAYHNMPKVVERYDIGGGDIEVTDDMTPVVILS